MTQDPKRILESSGADLTLAMMMRLAEDDVLEPEAVERVRMGVMTAAVIGSTASSGGAGGAAGVHSGGKLLGPWAVKAILVGLAATAGVGGVLTVGGRPRVAPAPLGDPSSLVASGPAPEPPPSVSATDGARVLTVPLAPNSRSGESSPPEVSKVAIASPAPRAVRQTPGDPAAATASTEALPVPHGWSTPGAPPAEASPSGVARGSTATPPTAHATPLPREGTLLLEARRALPRDPTRALELVRQHAKEFPSSQLAPERERIAAEAQSLADAARRE